MSGSNLVASSPSGHDGFPWKHVIGFFLSLVLTAAALWFVFSLHLSKTAVIVAILLLAVCQVLVQLLLFMHLTESDGPLYHIVAFVFGLLIAFGVVAGSIWVMGFASYVS